MGVNVVYVQSFREACEKSRCHNPLYIGDDGDLFRLHGRILSEESPPIYVSKRVTVSKFMGAALSRFQTNNHSRNGRRSC